MGKILQPSTILPSYIPEYANLREIQKVAGVIGTNNRGVDLILLNLNDGVKSVVRNKGGLILSSPLIEVLHNDIKGRQDAKIAEYLQRYARIAESYSKGETRIRVGVYPTVDYFEGVGKRLELRVANPILFASAQYQKHRKV